MTTATQPQFVYAHRGAGAKRTTYAVVDVTKVTRAALALVGVLAVVVIGLFVIGHSGAADCRAVPVAAQDAGHLAAQGWTIATGESMVAPGCAAR
jgi:hypothetical protein